MTRNLAAVAEVEERREAIRAAAAEFLRGEWALAKLRELIESDEVADAPALWQSMKELGWHDVTPDTSDRAIGVAEFCAIVEETGRALAPTPLVPCVVARAILRATGATLDVSLPVLAHAETARSTDSVYSSVAASSSGGGYRIDGVKRFVAYGVQADLVIVQAVQADGAPGLFAIDPNAPSVERRGLILLDGSPCAEVAMHGVEVPAVARIASGDDAVRVLGDALALETTARCAELVGVGARALDIAVAYAKERIAFGRAIGSFQAVQHKLVDLHAHVELARALYQGAAGVGANQRRDRDVAVAMAAFAALDSLRKVPEGALQIFGGVGTTWEHDIHFFLRRAATLCALLGERAGHREAVARHLATAK
jgi:alkylation response protein AidB-like acyl-CoA dehydrogenase